MAIKLPIIQGWQVPTADGLAKPWWTHPFLAELERWDTRDWNVFEWGSGYSSLWLAQRCRFVVAVDDRLEFRDAVQAEADARKLRNLIVWYREWSHDAPSTCPLVQAIHELPDLWDIITIDGDHGRNECAEQVPSRLKPGGIVVLDNADWDAFAPVHALFREWEHHEFRQLDHPEGWRTDYWVKPR